MHKKICGKGMALGNIDKALAWNQRSNRIVGHFSCRYPIRVTCYNDFCVGVDTLLVMVLYWPWKPVCLLHSPLDQTLAALQGLQQWNNVVWKFWTVTLCEKRYLSRWDLTEEQVYGFIIEKGVGVTAIFRKFLVLNALNTTLQLILLPTSWLGLSSWAVCSNIIVM